MKPRYSLLEVRPSTPYCKRLRFGGRGVSQTWSQIPAFQLMSSALLATALFSSLTLTACSPQIGNTIEVRNLPTPPAASPGPKVGFGKTIAVGPFTDSRIVPTDEAPTNGFSEAVGNTSQLFEDQLRELLLRQGYTITDHAPIRIKGDIVRWNTQVRTTAMTEIASHASIAVEVVDENDRPIYSATYIGTRSSETPVASKNDIRTSLAIAAANAAENVVEDQRLFQAILSKY